MVMVPYFSYPGRGEAVTLTSISPPSGCVPVRAPYSAPHVGHTGLQPVQNECRQRRVSLPGAAIGSMQMGHGSSSSPGPTGGVFAGAPPTGLVQELAVFAGAPPTRLVLELGVLWERNSFSLARCTKDPVAVRSPPPGPPSKRISGNLVPRRQGRGLQVGRRPLVERDEPLPDQVVADGERGGVARSENHPLRAAGLVELFDGETAPLNLLKFLGVFLVDEGHDDPGHGHRRDVRRGAQAGAEGLQLLKGSSHRVDAGLLLQGVRQKKLLQSHRVFEVLFRDEDTDVRLQLQTTTTTTTTTEFTSTGTSPGPVNPVLSSCLIALGPLVLTYGPGASPGASPGAGPGASPVPTSMLLAVLTPGTDATRCVGSFHFEAQPVGGAAAPSGGEPVHRTPT
ncbi:hypothetical protein EYF80_025557 [Liparis tanakae]|uniref:Uncharacterized protein n=1 Tax=Liparis tanakae TaxID=230148 RepID=A0A4Z2HEC7_9TELE|nr:hypothetical protein EYF80_025557 [Liparis tanakae]